MFFQPYWFKQSLCGRQTSQMDHNNPALGWHFNHNLLRDLWNREVRLCVLSCFGHVRLFASLWILACQAPLSMGFPRQEYWSGLPCPSPGDLPDPEIKPISFMSLALAGGFFTTSATWEAHVHFNYCQTGVQERGEGHHCGPTLLSLFTSGMWDFLLISSGPSRFFH